MLFILIFCWKLIPLTLFFQYDNVAKFSAGVIVNRGGSHLAANPPNSDTKSTGSHLAANPSNSDTKSTGNQPNSVDSGIGSPRSHQGPAYSPKV